MPRQRGPKDFSNNIKNDIYDVRDTCTNRRVMTGLWNLG